MNVVKMEKTWDIGVLETNRAVELWSAGQAGVQGYDAGRILFYFDKVYEVLQDTTGVFDEPYNQPTYYDEIADVVDIYLDPFDPDNFTLAALPPLIAPTAQYLPDVTRNVNQLRGKTWQFAYQYTYMDYRRSTYSPASIVPEPLGTLATIACAIVLSAGATILATAIADAPTLLETTDAIAFTETRVVSVVTSCVIRLNVLVPNSRLPSVIKTVVRSTICWEVLARSACAPDEAKDAIPEPNPTHPAPL